MLVDASASDNVGVTSVEFRATGGALHDAVVGPATLTIYGWIGTWNTTGVADGTYTLQSVAVDAAGNTGRSAAITVKVDNTADRLRSMTARRTAHRYAARASRSPRRRPTPSG